ncbi:hypothetical protein CLAIMM_11827 [Cladophialophora immunda]|nr:hypothetical protein CLAIMM_11827 [Cladophialophora immunda]
MTTSSSRPKSGRSNYYEPDATYATTITDEPSQISDRYRNDSRKELQSSDTRKRSSKTDGRTKYEKSRGDKEDNDSWKPRKEDSTRDSHKSSKSSGRERARVHRDNSASLPQNQFPGEFPATYSEPYRPPGLAAEYYGDNGESVAFQPGVRPNAPNIVTSAEQAHLLEPTVEAKPPPEPSSMGQVGAAASYFGHADYDGNFGSQTTPSKPPQRLSLGSDKPPKHSYYGASPRSSPVHQGSHAPTFGLPPGPIGSYPSSGTAAIGEAAEYYAGGGGGGGGGTSASVWQTPNRPLPGSQTTSTPYSAPAGIGGSHQHSTAALYGGAAALAGAAAGAYVSGHSHHQHPSGQLQPSTNLAGPAHGYPLSQNTQMHHAHRHKHQGLFGRFIDWWRDPEAVARFEEYTETIGVCKYCFDPMSSPADAPRRHDYRRRRQSPGNRYGSTTRVDKIYRHSSDENLRKHSSIKKKMAVGGLTGYGAAKLGQAITKQKHDFDDTYSVKSGRPVNQSRVSFQEEQQFQRYDDAGFERPQSRQRASRSKTSSTQRGHHGRRSSSSSSNSSSRPISHGAALSAGLGAAGVAVGAAALNAGFRRRSKSRSRSPSSRKKYFSKRVSPMHSYVDLSATNDAAAGGLLSFFTSPSANSRKGKKPKGLFNFSNASSSSSDADLRFGEGTVRRKTSKKRLRERQGRQHRNDSVTAMEDLVNTGTALADEANWRERKGRQKYEADKHTGLGGRLADGRRISMADHETHGGPDDEWYDTDGGGDSETSVDMAMAYGGRSSASQSREHLPQAGRASVPGYNFREADQRQYHNSLGQANNGSAPSFPISTVETAALAGAAGALGGWTASNALSQESKPPTYSALDPMRELEPRPLSDPPSKTASHEPTRVSSTTVPLQQPQPMVPLAPFIDHNISEGIQFGEQTRQTGRRTSSYTARDSKPAKIPSQGPRSSVNFNSSDEQLESGERASGRDKRRMVSFGENDGRKLDDAAISMESTQKPAVSLRDETSPRPKRSHDVRSSSFDADDRVAEIDRELERLYQEHQKAEKRKQESGLKKAVVGAAAAVAVASIASKGNKSRSREEDTPTRKSNLKKTREKDATSSPETQQERIARMAAHRVRSTPSPVQHDDYSAFFVPTEIKEHLKEHNDKSEHRDDFGATVVEIVPGVPKPSSSHPFDPFTYRQFGLELDDDPLLHPWPVPILALVEPTPPGSRVQSVKGDETPIIEPKSKEEPDDIGEPLERRESKVTWGNHDTYVYDVVTPEYERSDYGPDTHLQGQKTTGISSPDDVTEEPISIPEESQERPSPSRAWTLDEKEAEKLEKEVPVVDDRPQISRAWTVDDKEAEELVQEIPERQPENTPGNTHYGTEDQHNPRDTTSSINGGTEERHGDYFPAEMDETSGKKAFYQTPFPETVSDLSPIGGYPTTVSPETKSRTVLALEDGGGRSDEGMRDKDNTSTAVRLSKSDRRRRERSSSSADAFRPFPSHQDPSGLSEDLTPAQPLRVTDNDRDLENKSAAGGPSALGLGIATSVLLATDQVMKDSAQHDENDSANGGKDQFSRPEGLTTLTDRKSQHPRSISKGGYHSDPEEWEHSREKPKRSKTGSKSEVGEKTTRKSKSRRTADSADFEPLRRSRTDDDLYENERSGRSPRYSNGDHDEKPTISRSSKGEERTSRGRLRKDSDGYHESDNRSVAGSTSDSRTKKESGGFFSNLFSSNKSDVSTSSKKSSKSSKSESRADQDRYDGSESRRKRRSKDKAGFDDVASAISEPPGRSRRSPDRQTVHDGQKEASNEQTVDDGFVSAEETAGTPVKDIADQESFLASRPEMPQPMVMDIPMGSDGVSGPRSERETSSTPNTTASIHAQGTTLYTEGEHNAASLTALIEGDRSGTLPTEAGAGVVEEMQSPEERFSAPFPPPATSRRLSAIRTGDILSSPMVASSPTAVPLHFRRPPISPTNQRFSMSSPVMSPSSPLTTPRTRQGRPKSTEFRSSKEFRPLYLVERRNYARNPASELAEEYPSLPSSKTSSTHPSMEDLRAEAHLQDQPESFTSSRISSEVFREHGRRHSYSYWHDGEKRRESPDYLDSRSATPVPGEAQRARDQEKKPKPKYEFHSPSELLQDPAFFHDVVPVDEDVVPHSPLPSVASTDADQDYMSARSRSLSPTGTRSRSRGRRSASTPRSTSASWRTGIATAAAGALVGSALAAAAHRGLKESQEIPGEEAETPRKPGSLAEVFTEVAPASEPRAVNATGAGNETTFQQPSEDKSTHTTSDLPRDDLHRDAESQAPTRGALSSDAWRDVFTAIHKRRIDPDVITDRNTAVNTESDSGSLQKPYAHDHVSPSKLEGMVLAQSWDGLPLDPSEVAEESIISPEKVARLEKESGENHEATLLAQSTAVEPFHRALSLEKQTGPIEGSQEGLGLQTKSFEEEATRPSDGLKSQEAADSIEGARLTSSETFPLMVQANREQADVETNNTEPKDVFTSDIQDVEDFTSGVDDAFEDATDMQPTGTAPELESETLAQPEAAHTVDVEEQNVASVQAAPGRSLAGDEASDTARPSLDPLEEAFKEAMEARGLTAGATVEAAYQAFQPEIPDVGGTQLSTIREEGEATASSSEQVSGSTEREAPSGSSKKERRKQKKAKKALTLDNPMESDSAPAEVGHSLQPAIEERQDLQTGETPNPFGDDFEIEASELKVPHGDVKADSNVFVAPGAAIGKIALSSTPDDDTSVPNSKKGRKGKKEKKKRSQSYSWDDVDPTQPGESALAVEPAAQQQPNAMAASDEPAPAISEGPGAPEMSVGSADTVQQESDYAPEMSSKSSKKKRSKRASVPFTIEETAGQISEEQPAGTMLSQESQPSTDQAAHMPSQTREPTFTEQMVREQVPVKETRSAPEPFVPQAIRVTSGVAPIHSSVDISIPEVAGDKAPQTPGAEDTQIGASLENKSDQNQTLDVCAAADSSEAEVPLAKQQLSGDNARTSADESEAAGPQIAPTDATVLVDPVTSTNETKQELKAVDTSLGLVPEVGVAQDEDAGKHLGLEFEANPAVAEGEQVHDKQEIAAPTLPAVVEERPEELLTTSNYDKGPATAQTPINETSPEGPPALEDEDIWGSATKRTRKDKKKKRAPASDHAEQSKSVQKVPFSDETVTKPGSSGARGDKKDTEIPTAPEPTGTLSLEDSELVEYEPRQDEDMFPVTTTKSKKDKKKKRASAFEGTEIPSSPQEGEIAGSIANSSIPKEGSTTEAPTTQEFAEVEPGPTTSLGREEPQDDIDGFSFSFKKKTKKSKAKAKKQRQSLLDDVAGSADDAGAENDKQLPTVLPTTPAAQIEGAGLATHPDKKTEAAQDLQSGDGKASPNVEDLNTGAVPQQPISVLPTEIAGSNEDAPEPADFAIDYHVDSLASLDVPKEMPPAPEPSLDKLPDEALQSDETTGGEAKVIESFADGTAAPETSTVETTKASIITGSRVVENPPPETAALVSPIEPTAEPPTEPPTDLANEPTTERTAELIFEPTTEAATDHISEFTAEHPSEHPPELNVDSAVEPEPLVEPIAEAVAGPITQASTETSIEAPIKTSAESTTGPLSEVNITTPTEAIMDTPAGLADEAGVKAGSEAVIKPPPSREPSAVPGDSEPMTEEDLNFSRKRSKKDKKNKKNKRQSTLTAETIQPGPETRENHTLADEPERDFDESTQGDISKSVFPEEDKQDAPAITKDIDEENIGSTYAMAKKDKKKKKRRSTQVADSPQLATKTDATDHSNSKSETMAESRPAETVTGELGPDSESMSGSALEATQPKGDVLTVEGDSENIRHEQPETSRHEDLAFTCTKSNKDKKRKKRQSNIESATPEPASEMSREEAFQPTANNVAEPFTIDETRALETVETLDGERNLPTPEDEAEERLPSTDKKKKNRKKGQKLKLDEASLTQDGEQVGLREDPYIESNVENRVKEQDVNLPETQPIPGPLTRREPAPAEAEDLVADTWTPEESTSIHLEGLSHQLQADDDVEESGKIPKDSKQDDSDVEKSLQKEFVPVKPVQNEAELLSEDGRRVPEMGNSLVSAPEDLTIAGVAETASTDPTFEQAGLFRKKTKKGKKNARQSTAEELEGQEAAKPPMGEDDSSPIPLEAAQPVTETEWPIPKKSKSKNGKRNSQQLVLDDSGAEPAPLAPEIEPATLKGSDEPILQTLPAAPDVWEAMTNQGAGIENWSVSKKNGRKKKRQATSTDVEGLSGSLEASTGSTPPAESEQSARKPSFSTFEGDVLSAPQTEDLTKEYRSDSAVVDANSKSIGDTARQDETLMNPTPTLERTIMEVQDPAEATTGDVYTTALADIVQSDSQNFQPSNHLVADVPNTTLPEENRADIDTVIPDSLANDESRGTPVLTEGVDEVPTKLDTNSAHVEESSISDAQVFTESKQAHNTERDPPETPITTPAAQSHFKESAGPNAEEPFGIAKQRFQENLPPEPATGFPNRRPEAETISTSEVPSVAQEVNQGIEDTTEEATLSSRPKKKKNKKQRQSTYEESISEPHQSENMEHEANPEEAETEPVTEPVVVDSPEKSRRTSRSNDVAAGEEIITSSTKAKKDKDKKKKRNILLVEDEVNGPQPTVRNDIEPAEEATISESQPEAEATAKSISATALELEPKPEHDAAEKGMERLPAQSLTPVKHTEDVAHGASDETREVAQASPPAANEMGGVGEPFKSNAGGEAASHTETESGTAEGTNQSIPEDIPAMEEPDTIGPGLSFNKKSEKEKRKSKRKSAFEEEEPTIDVVDGPRIDNEVEMPQNDVPAAPNQSSISTEIQSESEWGFSSKRSKKKGKLGKAPTATDGTGTPGTATTNSNEEFASAMQTPIQRTASPELMDSVKAEQTALTAPEAGTADYFTPAPTKKKSKKDKKRKSLLPWTGNEDQTTEDASGTLTLALLPESEAPKTGLNLASAALAAGPKRFENSAEDKHEISTLPTESQVTTMEDTLESDARIIKQEPLRSEDDINVAAGTGELMFQSAGLDAAPNQYALNKKHDPTPISDQSPPLSTSTQPRDETLPSEIEVDPGQPSRNIADDSLPRLTESTDMISSPPETKTSAESENDQLTPSLREPDDSHEHDEPYGFVSAHSRVPEATRYQQDVFETDMITPEEQSTAAKIDEANTMTTTTIAASEGTDSKRGLEETDFDTNKDNSKRKKSKKDKKDKKSRKKSRISDGAEDTEPPKIELDQNEALEPGVFEAARDESTVISDAPEQLPENAEDLSDVSATTRERRKRRRSPPAWAGEEPEDLPRGRALTPPPEHDDIMDTALGIAAGLGFGAGENESTRESSRNVPSPARQPSSGWSFAKLDPITKLAHADTNRDSGVQFESPTLSSGQFITQRDSGYIPSPTIGHGEFSSTRDRQPDMNLRPPRPQSPTSSTEDVSKAVTSRQYVDQPASLETPRRKPSPVESTSKDRSSVLFNSSPAMPSPLNTDIRSRSPQPIASPLRRSPSIHGHHHSREELRQQKARISPRHEDSDQLASNLIDRSAAAPVTRAAFDSHSHNNPNRPYSPGKTTLNAINEDVHEPTSQAHPFSDPPASLTPRHSAENDSLAAAGLVAAAGAATFAAANDVSRDSPAPGAKSLGRTKSRTSSLRNLRSVSISPYDPANFASGSSQGPINTQSAGKAAVREREMAEIYDGYGSYPGSPRSPTRPPSIRRRQSMQQIRDLEAKLDQLASENRSLAEAKIVTEQQLEQAHFERNRNENATVAFNAQLQERDADIARLKQEVASLIAAHESLKQEHEQSLFSLRQNHEEAQSQWQDSLKELETLRSRHNELSTGMESIVRHEIDTALSEKNAEIQRLRGDLEASREKIRDLQSQILSRGADDVVVFHDEDYFDQACQKLCQQVQGWVLRFSKFSDLKLCRTTSEVRDEKIVDRFDNAILDGSDVDVYLADRVKRRDVFMSVVMTMIWEYVFTRYLFGMDRDQRQKLKQLEKNLGEVGPQSAIHQWRALTLTLLSKRESFKAQRESDTEAVAIEIFSTLSRFLPPPQHLEEQIVGSLRNVMRTAVELSIEMRTQRAEYIMLPPLQPEYDTNGDLARKVYFNASLMNERSGETTSNEELEREHAVVRMVLFPLVVKKGDDNGVGDEEIVVCPAQVLIARPDKGKRVKSSTRHASGGSDAKSLRAVSTHSLAMSGIEGNENMF